MGYKPGMMLGKKGTGRAEPIPINVRSGRGGLGQEAERKRKQEQSALMRASRREKRLRQEAKHLDDYRLKQSRMMAEKEAESDLHKSQRVCEELDEAEGVTEPEEMYYWTEARMALLTKPSCKDKYSSWDDEVASDDEPPMGFHFTDDSNKEIYKDILNRDDDDDTDEEEDELPSTFEQLEKLTHYLRSKYLYCVWCGTRYDDTDDLKQNCPGDTAKAHDD